MMKKHLLLLLLLTAMLPPVFAAQNVPATGRVVDQNGLAVEFATVVLLRNDTQAAGVTTGREGHFELKVPAGDYTLLVQFLGYETLKQTIKIGQQSHLGDLVLRSSPTRIDDVVVRAPLIRRQADRFIVDVANTPAAIGKSGVELLERAPGVWIDGEKISINGKTGSKVFINDRELKYEPAQLITYLQALKASEIQRIEIVPMAGADYDADTSGGIIRITLRKLRTNGIEGSLSTETKQSNLTQTYSPSGDIRFHSGRLDLYASGWGFFGDHQFRSIENTSYTDSNSRLHATSKIINNNYDGGGTIGAVFELSDRNSIGGEFSTIHIGEPSHNTTFTDLITDIAKRTDSRFDSHTRAHSYEATFNYIHRLDTLGSTLKVIADYAHRTTHIDNNNVSRVETSDSLFRDNTASAYSVAALTLALEKHFSSRWTLRSGVKYTRNAMDNDTRHEYFKHEVWQPNSLQSFRQNYTENIAAAYGIITATLGRWNAVAGLRGEYTHTTGKGGRDRDYFSLFPNANVSYALTKDGAYSLIAQYARTIRRPSFSTMTPQRMQISDYTYQIGNPNLTPAYTQEVSMTLVLTHKYTFSGGLRLRKGEIEQTILPDPTDPNSLYMTWINFDRMQSYYLSANLPFQPTAWWSLTADLNYSRDEQRVDAHTPSKSYNSFRGTLSTTFTLPRKFYVDCTYTGLTSMHFGTVSTSPQHRLGASIKKRFGDQWTLWVGVENLLDQGQVIHAQGAGFHRRVDIVQPWTNRTYKLGISFDFKSGKSFNRKSVEAGASGDKGRM